MTLTCFRNTVLVPRPPKRRDKFEYEAVLVPGCLSSIWSQPLLPVPAQTSNPTKTHPRATSQSLSQDETLFYFPDLTSSSSLANQNGLSVVGDQDPGHPNRWKRKGLRPHMPSSVFPIQAAEPIFMPRRLRGPVVGKSRSEHLTTSAQSLFLCCLNSHSHLFAWRRALCSWVMSPPKPAGGRSCAKSVLCLPVIWDLGCPDDVCITCLCLIYNNANFTVVTNEML